MAASNPQAGLRRVACLGDSISDVAFRGNVAWPYWLDQYLQNSRVTSEGVSGNDTAAVLARLHDGAINTYTQSPYFLPPTYTRGLCPFMIGVNDFIFQTADAAQAQANHTACCNYLTANGWRPILIPTMPFGGHTAWTAAMEANRVAFNTYIRGLAGTYQIIDLEPTVTNFATAGQPKLLAAYDGGDGLHPGVLGAKFIALSVALALS